MAPVYSGSLPPKKKSELQEIALSLRISDQGTKDDLVQRITKHLDKQQDELEDHPTFTGLYGRRKRSVQPQPIPTTRLALFDAPQSTARRSITLDPIIETTPTKQIREVSSPLKQPIVDDSDPSPIVSPAKRLIERLQHVPVQSVVRRFRDRDILQSVVISLRSFLSNSRNIWYASAVTELFYVLWSIIPWQSFEIPAQGRTITLHYPPLVVFQTATFWLVLLHWSLPTLIIPAFFGCFITFNPAFAPSQYHLKRTPVAPLDPLTASIIRLAAQIGYPYPSAAVKNGIVGLDVLGSNWRILSASVGLAFSFAEAIAIAPRVLTDAVVSRDLPLRRAIEEAPPDEVD